MYEQRIALVVAGAFALLSSDVQAQPVELGLQVARICYLEATFRDQDCVMIWHVARKRAAAEHGIALEQVTAAQTVEMLEDYSAIKARNPRAQEVSEYPDSDVSTKGKRWNAQWATLRKLARELCDGRHADPCPPAQHWGGSMDPPRGGMVPARCSVVTANTFYVVRRSRAGGSYAQR